MRRSSGDVTEDRVFLRAPDTAEPSGSGTVSNLLALVPPDAGMYKASSVSEPADVATLIVQKLIGPQPHRANDWRNAPLAVSPDNVAGNESDLETRIDEQPLPSDAGISDSIAAVRTMVEKSGVRALLLVQSSSPAAATFVRMPSVIVLDGVQDWDLDSVRTSLSAAAGKLWTTSQLGAGWVSGTAGRHPMERLDGLGTLMFASNGRLLFLSNDSRLLAAVLDRTGTTPPTGAFTYAAGFRHLLERPNFGPVMTALDFNGLAVTAGPAFFSGNISSLSRVLSNVSEIRVSEEERGNMTMQVVRYQMAQ